MALVLLVDERKEKFSSNIMTISHALAVKVKGAGEVQLKAGESFGLRFGMWEA
jgi:hypothetical protein